MTKLKYSLFLVSLFFASLFACNKLSKPEIIMIAGTEISLEKPWNEFSDMDDSTIGDLIRSYNFKDGERNFKKGIGRNDYIIACLYNDRSWIYYYYYHGAEAPEMMMLSKEIQNEISPPL